MKEIVISPSLELLVKITLIMANIAIVAGIIIALLQYNEATKFNESQIKSAELFEKRKNGIEAVNKVYNNEFISSLAKLKGNKNLKNNEMINAWNLVFNTYFSIATVYNNNIADKEIIKRSIKQEIIEFVDLPAFKDSLKNYAENEIIKMVNNINSNSEEL